MRRWKTDGLRYRRLAAAAFAFLPVFGGTEFTGFVRAESPAGVESVPSGAKLERISDYIRHEIATGKIPGAIMLIQRHGKPVYSECFGERDTVGKRPMSANTIFRLYSMSKPITSVAIMMLVEDGELKLDDPIEKYIPAFADARVGVDRFDAAGHPTLTLEPLRRSISIRDLLQHTSGITYGIYGDDPARKRYAAADLFNGDFDNAELADRIAHLPLAEQPGTLWDYGHSTDILGRLVEVVSGKSLLQFERERLLDPLKMTETAFYVTDEADFARIAEPMPNDRDILPVVGIRDPRHVRRPQSGGAGMVGTITDYARFAQMLLNGGELDGRRYLSAETVASMTTDHVGPQSGIARDRYYFPGDASGFGFGFAVRTRLLASEPGPVGEYRWDGVAGTFFWIDPKDDMFVIFMAQTPSQRGRIQSELRKLVYDAFESNGAAAEQSRTRLAR
jgi:CubicO group peptidase (beta-lactamase class C family)